MNPTDALLTLGLSDWEGPFLPEDRAAAQAALEGGMVLFLPQLRFMIGNDEQDLLDPSSLGGGRKNISLDPATGKIANVAAGRDARMAAMMGRYAAGTLALVRGLFPGYAATLQQARTSFRPAEIAGRNYSPRHDDRLLHVDAFPTRPLHGRRILRVFANIAADGAPREWLVGEPFPSFAAAFHGRVRAPLPGSAWVRELLGLTKGRRSEYDHLMLGLHDVGKLDAGYQANGPKLPVSFPAGSVWMCFTDQVLHAALAGHCALEQTFHLPVEAMAHPEQSPLRVLEQMRGRALA